MIGTLVTIVLYVIPMFICITAVFCIGTKGVAATYSYPNKPSRYFWMSFPFGEGFAVAPMIGGFAIFPVINFFLAISLVYYTVYKLDKMNMKFSEIWERLE